MGELAPSGAVEFVPVLILRFRRVVLAKSRDPGMGAGGADELDIDCASVLVDLGTEARPRSGTTYIACG